jgi:uncharacterized protein (DUF2225 family)
MAEPLFFVEKNCAVCEQKFKVTRVRSRLAMIKQDTDFCAHFKEVNPYYYTVIVCPHCGYAAQDNFFDNIVPAAAEKVKQFFSQRKVHLDLSGIRDQEQAIVSYQLAILCANLVSAPASRLAALQLRLGWIYRESGQKDKEIAALAKAAECFEMALSRERTPIGSMSELAVMYLVGDLLHRTGDNEKALLYLSKVVSSPQARQEKRVADLARDVWQDMRAEERKK